LFADGQPQSGPLVVSSISLAYLGEGLEKIPKFFIRNAAPRIFNGEKNSEGIIGARRKRIDLDVNVPALCEFEGVADQIGEHLL
jgi:hypothetical protein